MRDEKYTIPRIDRLLKGEPPESVFNDPAPTENSFPGARGWNQGSHNQYLLFLCMLSFRYPAPCAQLAARWCTTEEEGASGGYQAGFMGNEILSPTYGGWIWGSLVRLHHHARAARVEPAAQTVIARWLLRMALLASMGSPKKSRERAVNGRVTFDGVGGLMAGMRGSAAKFAEPQLARVLTPAFGIDPRIPPARLGGITELPHRLTRGLPQVSFGLIDRTAEACRRIIDGEAEGCKKTIDLLASAFHGVPAMVDFQVGRSEEEIVSVLWFNSNGNTGPLSATRAPADEAEWAAVAAFRPDLFSADFVEVGRKYLVDGVAPCRVLYCSKLARWRSGIGRVPVTTITQPEPGVRCADACEFEVALTPPAELPLSLRLTPSGSEVRLQDEVVQGCLDIATLLPSPVG